MSRIDKAREAAAEVRRRNYLEGLAHPDLEVRQQSLTAIRVQAAQDFDAVGARHTQERQDAIEAHARSIADAERMVQSTSEKGDTEGTAPVITDLAEIFGRLRSGASPRLVTDEARSRLAPFILTMTRVTGEQPDGMVVAVPLTIAIAKRRHACGSYKFVEVLSPSTYVIRGVANEVGSAELTGLIAKAEEEIEKFCSKNPREHDDAERAKIVSRFSTHRNRHIALETLERARERARRGQ